MPPEPVERLQGSTLDAEPSALTAMCGLMGHPIPPVVTTGNTTTVIARCACGIPWTARP